MKKNYKKVEPNLDLVKLEKETLSNWASKKIFEKVNQKGKNAPNWTYYDGPITANGIPHYGHALTWTMKDVVPRYYSMRGNFVSRNIGWDCQGIIVEYEVEKALGFKHKSDIGKMGIAVFNQKCKDSVLKFRKTMIKYETRLGRWIDHNDEYSTMDTKYIESLWWSVKELYNKGLLFEGYKVVAYSTRTGMNLSTHEVADGGYKDIEDPAVTVKFKLSDEQSTYLLAWTTTPWTLPGNLMLALGKKVEYVKVKSESNFYILAKDRVEHIFKDKEHVVVSEVGSESLIGKSYQPLFNFYAHKKPEGVFRIIFADHVNTQEGTGIVHLAPYGAEDFDIFMSMKITLFDYLNDTGEFTTEIPPYAGMFYKNANEKIIEDLEKLKLLFHHEKYVHSMPIDYRTKTPLIYKPIKSWYVNINKIKPRLIEESKKVKFIPELAGERFVNWIENARDWSLSRRRYWGTPMPIWINDKTADIKVVGSFKELEELSGKSLPNDFDPHKPFADDILWNDPKGGTYRRVPEVIDVWYDSGSMPFARHHYPFENKELFTKSYPAEYISESDDQIRLWFYTMFVLGVSLFEATPFKNVLVTGMLQDEHGKKMSKSKGNYPPIEEVFEKYGSDMLRYFLLTSPIVKGEATNFSYKLLEETKKEIFTTLWNSYRYFMTYADLYDFESYELESPINALDRWILARLKVLKNAVNEDLNIYEIMKAAREFAPFVQDLSNWYIRRSRDKISKGDKTSLNVLYHCLLELSKLMAPFIVFLSDEIYLGLTRKEKLKSVHLEDYPFGEEVSEEEQKLLHAMWLVRIISSIASSARKEFGYPIRQPLSEMLVYGIKDDISDELLDLLADELNVKTITLGGKIIPESESANWINKAEPGINVFLNIVIDEKLKIEGIARELVREIQKLRKAKNVTLDEKLKVQYPRSSDFDKAVLERGDEIREATAVFELVAGDSFKIL